MRLEYRDLTAAIVLDPAPHEAVVLEGDPDVNPLTRAVLDRVLTSSVTTIIKSSTPRSGSFAEAVPEDLADPLRGVRPRLELQA